MTDVALDDRALNGNGSERRTRMIWWFGVVVLGRLYTVLLCDIPEPLFGIDWLCRTWFHDIPSYLWVELVLYGPIMWLALHQITADVFGDVPSDPEALARHRRIEFAATAAAAIFLYGVGVHVADTIEVFSRERVGVTDGAVYDLVYFLDEGLSHYIQFIPLFFIIGWFVIFDRPGRHEHSSWAMFLGAAHGVERGLGTIEGEKWFLAGAAVAWMALAAWLRRRRVGPVAADEFFFRYALVFTAMLPATQLAYVLWFDGVEPPSGLDDGDYAQLAIGASLLTLAATAIAIGADRLGRARRSSSAES